MAIPDSSGALVIEEFQSHQGHWIHRTYPTPAMKTTRADPFHRQLVQPANDTGSIMVEYVVLLLAVAFGCMAAMLALGVPLVQLFMAHEVWLMLAVP